MFNITINGKKLSVGPGYTIIQACQMAGVEIPRFCYHERLKIAGNCRMCLVEVEGGPPKPVASCATPISDGMVVHTNTEKVRRAREGVMEFLLANHPLDCPICDQGGECDLQDQAMLYGRGTSRFSYPKRAVSKKEFGPLVATEMNRCIHCTRCVRFLSDVAGVEELGLIGRGGDAEISTYVQKSLSSELSGNIIDLCPVGALTSKPYAFTARPWELTKVETIDVMDALGSNIRVDVRGKSVMRILPRLNDEINEEWLTDKARFSYDGIASQRLDRCYIRKQGKLQYATWTNAIAEVVAAIDKVTKNHIAGVVGDLVDVESVFLMKKLMKKMNVERLECRQNNASYSAAHRSFYTFNSGISGIDKADLFLLVGVNFRQDSPLLGARIRNRFLESDPRIFSVGCVPYPEIFPVENLGASPSVLQSILDGSAGEVCNALEKASAPMIIVGDAVLSRRDSNYLQYILHSLSEKFGVIKEGWHGLSVLQKNAATTGALDLGFYSNDGIESALRGAKVVYLLGADECMDYIPEDAFVIYQGHHGDKGAARANVVLPGSSYVEKDALYVNTEGRVQIALKAIQPPGEAKDDREIILRLADNLGVSITDRTLPEIRQKLCKVGPQFEAVGEFVPNSTFPFRFDGEKVFAEGNIVCIKESFYMTNTITRSSKIMASCREEFEKC